MKATMKWHYLYFALAGLDIFAVVASLALSHRMSSEYANVVHVNRDWSFKKKEVDHLAKLAQAVNAPGNDVFDSKNVPKERENSMLALQEYEAALDQVKKSLIFSNNSQMTTEFASLIGNVDNRMKEMIDETNLIFKFFEKKREDLAGSRMATMDRKYGLLLDSIGSIRNKVKEVQESAFIEQQTRGEKLKELEYFVAGFILLMVLGVTLYGRKMSRFVADSLEKERIHAAEIEAHRATLIDSAKMSSLGMMAGGIAHELNNPLSIILGRANQAARKLSEGRMEAKDAVEVFSKIEAVCKRMSKIIHGLRTFSRNADQDPMAQTSLKQIVEETLELCQERIRNQGIEMRVGTIPDYLLTCRATQLSQVLLNLVNNAHDAIQGFSVKWIALDFQLDHEFFSLRVTDCGHGIPVSVAEKLMVPFFTTKEVGKGTGLGLSISKGIMETHGGTLSLDQHSPNTCFVMKIPASLVARDENVKKVA